MGRPIDYEVARRILKEEFEAAEREVGENTPVVVQAVISESTSRLLASRTQAFREALIGCCLARIIDQEIDIRLPYIELAPNAFTGRSLDENVVNPFLHDRMVPCSKSPYLSTIRRGFTFHPESIKRGVRDKGAYEAMLDFIGELEIADKESARSYLRHLLTEFVRLREAANIQLAQIARLSLEQYRILIAGMLAVPSGGLIPVLLAVAMFQTIKECFKLGWVIEWQGINVADQASGAGGDITIKDDGETVLVVEVTERSIDRSRVVATFNTKIALHGISDYLFFFGNAGPGDEAKEAARQYFAQGHDISFLSVEEWLVHSLGTVGPKCRRMFTEKFLNLLGLREVSAGLKMAWNDEVRRLLGG